MDKGAIISPCGRYRYSLWRRWAAEGIGRVLVFLMLNPSTADGEVDDATIRRCIGFGVAGGFTAIDVVNLYALRATDPRALRLERDPIGPDNDEWLRLAASRAARSGGAICLAYGANPMADERVNFVLPMLRVGPELQCLRITRSGYPAHPLYLPASLTLRAYDAAAIDEAMHG